MNEKQIRESIRQALKNTKIGEGCGEQGKVKDPEKKKDQNTFNGVQEGTEEELDENEEELDENEEEALNKESFVPQDKEHLQENKLKLNKELMSRWGFNKKGKKLNG